MKIFTWIALLTSVLVPAVCRENIKCTQPKCQVLNVLESHNELPLRRAIPTTMGGPHVYCYKGLNPYSLSAIFHVWNVVLVSIATGKDASLPVWLFLVENGTQVDPNVPHESTLALPPFGESCVEVKVTDSASSPYMEMYSLTVRHKLKVRYIVLLAVGLILFISAPSASRNVGVYYSWSVLLGVMMSLLLLLFIFSRMIPKTSLIGWGVLVGGYTVAASIAYWMWHHTLETVVHFWKYLFGYVVLSGLVTFAAVYRIGAPDPRTMNLLQWGAQLVALVLVYFSLCQLPVVALFGVVLTVCWPHLAKSMCRVMSCTWECVIWCVQLCRSSGQSGTLDAFIRPQLKPQRQRLLTKEEYRRVGVVETKAALEKLREHCRRAPKGNIWNTIGALHEPKRFLEFLSGKDDVQPCEQFEYHRSLLHHGSHDTSPHDASLTTSPLSREAIHRSGQRLQSDRSLRSHAVRNKTYM